jgi:lysophospholipase L1-like esterase
VILRRAVASFVLLLVVGALCLLAAELAASRLGLLEYPPQMNRGHPTRGYTLRPGFEGESKFGIPFRVSAQGFRSPEVAVPKPAGTHRVLVLGDSVTWGAGVREEETFSRRLEAELGDELACAVEVVNAGISGYGSIEELDVLRNDGLALEPDVVLVYHVENDNQISSHERGGLAVFLKDHLLYRSYLFGSAFYAWRVTRWRLTASQAGGDVAAWAAAQRAWDQRPGTAASLDALREIGATAQAHGARAILASHPARLDDPTLDAARNRLLRETAQAAGMTFVDVTPVLRALPGELAVSEIDHHPNGYAHGWIASALRPAVREALGCTPRAGAAG